MSETQELSPEQQREQVRQKVVNELKEKHTKEDGTIDFDGIANDFWKVDERLHYTRAEAKDRRLREEEHLKSLEDREKKIKEFEEAELIKQKKYEEIITAKNTEIAGYKEQLSELEELKNFKSSVYESQKGEVEKKVAQLGKEQLELYNVAIEVMPEDAYQQKLNFLDKLFEKKQATVQMPTGGVSSENAGLTQESLMKLKETDPVTYKRRIREQVRSTK